MKTTLKKISKENLKNLKGGLRLIYSGPGVTASCTDESGLQLCAEADATYNR